MCTAVALSTKDFYFGRNLDLEYHYKEEVTVTPRLFPFEFRKCQPLYEHYAIIGMATVSDGYPLYYDATNEAGLSMAGLNFPGFAVYRPEISGFDNIATFELIPWILGSCKSISEAKIKLSRINITGTCFSDSLPVTPLHWIISDKTGSITLESVAEGLRVHNNPLGILTNSPGFDYHMLNLTNYMQLTKDEPQNSFSDKAELSPYSHGMGAMGLPGDLSSCSRFVRAAFTKLNSQCGDSEAENVNQFFHILKSVEHTKGTVKLGEKYEITQYSSCCNTDKGIYYYTTYENSRITAVNMNNENPDSKELIRYPLNTEFDPFFQN